MDNKQKILVCGDVDGNFKQLFNRVESINKKNGPFELLLCVGSFFNGKQNDELEAYKNGNKIIPVPTYILGPNSPDECPFYTAATSDGEICPNLTYLGKRGLYTVASGLKIAYVSGIESTANENSEEFHFSADDVRAVKNSCLSSKTSMGDYRGIDILLTSQWPYGIHKNPDPNADENIEKSSSKLLSWLAMQIKPRYHFCARHDFHYEREPYRNSADSQTQLELATRFLSMAAVGNVPKMKYIFALNIQPVDKIRLLDLIQKTTNETKCPYENINLTMMNDRQQQQQSGDTQQYFYDMKSPSDRNYGNNSQNRKRRTDFDGEPRRQQQRKTFDQEKCWFCLSSPSVEKHLIISIGDNFYLAMAKGPIDETHLLILSVTHIQSAALLSGDDWIELDKFKDALRNYFKSQNKVVTFFERNYKSSHLQINAIAVPATKEWCIKMNFDDKADEYKLQLEQLPELTAATQLPDVGPYFVAELPDRTTRLTRQMKQFPLHFGREVFCTEELLNCEAKIDWKECQLTKDEEMEMVKRVRKEFEPFDFTR